MVGPSLRHRQGQRKATAVAAGPKSGAGASQQRLGEVTRGAQRGVSFGGGERTAILTKNCKSRNGKMNTHGQNPASAGSGKAGQERVMCSARTSDRLQGHRAVAHLHQRARQRPRVGSEAVQHQRRHRARGANWRCCPLRLRCSSASVNGVQKYHGSFSADVPSPRVHRRHWYRSGRGYGRGFLPRPGDRRPTRQATRAGSAGPAKQVT